MLGLQIIDVSDPQVPVSLGSYRRQSPANDVTVVDSIAYVAADHAGLQIIDVDECSNGCDADLIDDGVLDFYDVSAFLIGFRMQNEIADFTNDGVIDFFDVIAFLDAFADGCP